MNATANTNTNTTAATVAGIAIPAVLPRQDASALIRTLIGNDQNILALALPSAKAEAALAVSLGIALQSAIHGDDSAYRRIETLARAKGKVTKAGKIAGKLGTMIEAFAQARDFGRAYRDLSSQEIDLTRMLDSPLCPSLPAPAAPKAAKAEPAAEPAAAEPAAAEPAAETPKTRESVLSVRCENRAPSEQAQRDRAAARIRALRAKLREMQLGAQQKQTKRQTKRQPVMA